MVRVFGSINVDLVARVAHLPRPGETVAGTAFALAAGGKGANQALAARQAGAQVALHGAVGTDTFAATALAGLAAAGVDLRGVARVPRPTGVALINVEAHGENAITVVAGANGEVRAARIADADLHAGTTVLLQLEVPLAEVAQVAQRARAGGARVVLNAAPASPVPDSLLECVDVFVVNENEAAFYAGGVTDAATFCAQWKERFGMTTVLTLGSRGAQAWTGGQLVHVAAPRVEVVDTTGAGDAFVGALAAALDEGSDLVAALRLGVAAGARACTWHGAQHVA